MYAKEELIKLIEGDKNIREDVLNALKKHRKEIDKSWPKKLKEVVFKRLEEI